MAVMGILLVGINLKFMIFFPKLNCLSINLLGDVRKLYLEK
jgi:hypothetical protein